MDEAPPAKPRIAFSRNRATGTPAANARKHVPMDDVLARMAGKLGEKRRAAEAARLGRDADEFGESA